MGSITFGQSRDKKTIACDSSCLAKVDAAAHKADHCVAIVCAQLLEDCPTVVQVIVAGCWGWCCCAAGGVSKTGHKTAWIPARLETSK